MTENRSPSQRWGAPLPIKDDETVEMRGRRSLGGALYGFLGGSVFSILSGTIDTLTYPDLPIYTDWAAIFSRWVWFGLGLAVVGLIIGWFTEKLKGIAAGASALALALLVISVTQADFLPMADIILVLILILPVSAICIPIALILRALANRHMHVLEQSGFLRARALVVLVFWAVFLGAAIGSLARTTGKAEQSLRTMDTLLQNAAAGQANPRLERILGELPAFKTHIGMGYQLSQQTSIVSAEGYEIKIIFDDGYQAICTMVAYGSQKPYVFDCAEGEVMRIY
jgi:hypothetical protein